MYTYPFIGLTICINVIHTYCFLYLCSNIACKTTRALVGCPFKSLHLVRVNELEPTAEVISAFLSSLEVLAVLTLTHNWKEEGMNRFFSKVS